MREETLVVAWMEAEMAAVGKVAVERAVVGQRGGGR